MLKLTPSLEIKAIFTLILLPAWLFPELSLNFYILIAILVFISWTKHKDNLCALGLLNLNLKGWKIISAVAACVLTLIIVLGISFNQKLNFAPLFFLKMAKSLIIYFFWSLLQQLLLQGFFVKRLADVFENRLKISVIAGTLFAALHAPNPLLMITTLLWGTFSACFFQKFKNIYLLAAVHAILAISIYYFLPDTWHHGLRIGLKFFTNVESPIIKFFKALN